MDIFVSLQEFQAAKKESVGFFSRVSSTFHNMSASYMMKNRGAEFENAHDYIHALSEKLAAIERISQRILKDQTGLQNLSLVLATSRPILVSCLRSLILPFQISCPS